MDFTKAIEIVASALFKTGTKINLFHNDSPKDVGQAYDIQQCTILTKME